MLWLWIVLIIIACVLALYGGMFVFIFVRRWANDITRAHLPKRSKWFQYKDQIKNGADWVSRHTAEAVSVLGKDGLRLYGRFFPADTDRRKVILLFHGYRSMAQNDFGCALEFYHNQGFHILLADQRAHGKSKGRLITFGVKERHDCKAWMEYINRRFDGNCELFLGGMSMGSATVLMALGLEHPPTLRGVIADCGFTSPIEIISAVSKKSHLPPVLLLRPVDLFCRLFGRFSIYDASSVTALRENTVPVLFIHGKADDFVPCNMSEENYAACKGPKKIVLVDGADHGLGFLVNPTQVQNAVTAFLADPIAACSEG